MPPDNATERRRTIAQVAEWLGLPRRTIEAWPQKHLDAELGSPGKWSLQGFARLAIYLGKARLQERDPLLSGSDDASPELERYRAARASLAELELSKKRGEVVDVGTMHKLTTALADSLRRLGERLERQHGAPAAKLLTDTLRSFDRDVERFFAPSPTEPETDVHE
jgi:hypothetical protein